MTIKDRFEAVENKALREKLLYYSARDARNKIVTTDADALMGGFDWSDTMEGAEYWHRLYKILSDDGCIFDRAYAIMIGSVPDMPNTPPPPPKPETYVPKDEKYRYFTSTNTIIVHRFVDDKSVWSATFDIRSFIAWAKENT